MKRGSGILLHVTSLPSPFGVGDLGPWAYNFADFLANTRQGYWQILPLTPTDHVGGNSPYFSISTFAGNKLLISPELLQKEVLLEKNDLVQVPQFPKNYVDYAGAASYKEKLFKKAFERFKGRKDYGADYDKFCSENWGWLEDFSLFAAIRTYFKGEVWSKWPPEIRDRKREALEKYGEDLRDGVEYQKFLQYIFSKQWFSLKKYCNQKGIQIIGDLPIYVNYDSADVWSNPDIFKLDEKKRPTAVGGVPPDYFSETGQLWGNPVYRWDVLKEGGYDWWLQRIERKLKLYDFMRIDHFRGLVGYWEVPAGEKTAVKGKWVKGPGGDLFKKIVERFRNLPVIAEDLGTITPDVWETMDRFGIPGMRVLFFAFGPDFPKGRYLPHNYVRNCVVYTTTHDTNTLRGWFENEASPEVKDNIFKYIGRQIPVQEIHLALMEVAMMSVADVAVIPMQDLLGLGEEARMNRPAESEGNWLWRLLPEQLTPPVAELLKKMTETHERTCS